MLVLGFQHRLGRVNARCQPVGEDRNQSILWGREALAVRSCGLCCLPMPSLNVGSLQGPQRRPVTRGVPLELRSKFHAHVHLTSIRNAQGKVEDSFKEGRCVFEKCAWIGYDVLGSSQHLHHFRRQLLEERMDARGNGRGPQRNDTH